MSNLKDPPGQFMSLMAGVDSNQKLTLAKRCPKTPYALTVIADVSGAVSAGLGYTLSTNGSTLHMQATAANDPKLMMGQASPPLPFLG